MYNDLLLLQNVPFALSSTISGTLLERRTLISPMLIIFACTNFNSSTRQLPISPLRRHRDCEWIGRQGLTLGSELGLRSGHHGHRRRDEQGAVPRSLGTIVLDGLGSAGIFCDTDGAAHASAVDVTEIEAEFLADFYGYAYVVALAGLELAACN